VHLLPSVTTKALNLQCEHSEFASLTLSWSSAVLNAEASLLTFQLQAAGLLLIKETVMLRDLVWERSVYCPQQLSFEAETS